MSRMSFERFHKTAKNMGITAGRISVFSLTPEEAKAVEKATEERRLAGKLPPEFYLDVNGQRVYGSITDLSDDYFDRKCFEVFKIANDSGEFVDPVRYVYPPKGQGPWDALMLVTSTFEDHTRPDFFGLYGETAGDLRIADRDGLHWWMVNWFV